MNGKENAAATVAPASENGHDDFLVRQKTKLESERILLSEEIKDFANPNKVNFNCERDPAWEAKIERTGIKIKAVDLALLRIKNGVYEICVGCGKPIERKVLTKYPIGKICGACTEPEPPKKYRRF